MPFEPHFEIAKEELPLQTQYRFAEIEINYAIRNCLAQLWTHDRNPMERAVDQLYFLLVPNEQSNAEKVQNWRESTLSGRFAKPLRNELIFYFTFNNASYQFIRQRTAISPNTIQNHRLKRPAIFPVYHFWLPEMLDKWDRVKHTLNLHLETLTHFPKDKQKRHMIRK